MEVALLSLLAARAKAETMVLAGQAGGMAGKQKRAAAAEWVPFAFLMAAERAFSTSCRPLAEWLLMPILQHPALLGGRGVEAAVLAFTMAAALFVVTTLRGAQGELREKRD